MKNIVTALVLGTALMMGPGCSDDNGGAGDTGTIADGAVDADTSCGTGIYPCGPYGAKVGDVAKNFSFVGYADPSNACKAHKDKTLDTGKTVSLSFKDWHLGDKACAARKKQVLWVMASAGWCQPCIKEVTTMSKDYATLDDRIGLLNVVFDSKTKDSPADEAFLKLWISSFTPSPGFPVVKDPSFQMGAFFTKSSAPFNLLLDVSTMKVLYTQTGGQLGTIKQKAASFLK